jgi:hypothetical protein
VIWHSTIIAAQSSIRAELRERIEGEGGNLVTGLVSCCRIDLACFAFKGFFILFFSLFFSFFFKKTIGY